MARKRILYLFPTQWDERQLEACRADWEAQYEVLFAEPRDADTPYRLDPLAYIDRTVEERRGRIDGVTSSSDYPGAIIAAAVASRLGLPGPTPESVVRCSHKLLCREVQRAVAPRAVPWFRGVRYDEASAAASKLEFPCFLKPVKGSFSQHARRIGSREELVAFLGRPIVADFCENYLAIFNALVRGLTDFEQDGRWFIAEGLLAGPQVTVEGYTHGGNVEILGVVDSVMHPGTNSFMRFDLPSRHPPKRVERMGDLARRVMAHVGLEGALFNMELVVDEARDNLSILEINPRICGQFGDLYKKVHGTSSYEVQLALAAGERPAFRRGAGEFGVASSCPLRTFEPVRVKRTPAPEDLAALRADQPDTLVWVEVAEGQELSDFETGEDGRSVRYAVVNLGAADAKGVEHKLGELKAALPFEFERLR
jgi:biotin carboxylase